MCESVCVQEWLLSSGGYRQVSDLIRLAKDTSKDRDGEHADKDAASK